MRRKYFKKRKNKRKNKRKTIYGKGNFSTFKKVFETISLLRNDKFY